MIFSPKIIFAYFLTIPNVIGISPLLFSEYLDLFSQLFSASLIYLIICNVIKLYYPKQTSTHLFYYYLICCFYIFEIFHYPFFSDIFKFAGFRTYLSLTFIAYSSYLSAFFGFLFLYTTSINSIFFSWLFLVSALLLNPVMGLIFFCLWCLLFYIKENNHLKFIIFTLTSIIISLTINIIFTVSPISTNEFINIYIYTRHQGHYHLSEIIDKNILVIAFLFLWPLATKIHRQLKKLFILCFLFIFGSLLIHFIFIELIPTKIIAILTPNRVVEWMLFLLLILYGLLFINIIDSKFKQYKILSNYNFKSLSINLIFFKNNKILIKNITYILLLLLFLFTPLYRYHYFRSTYIPDSNAVNEWLLNNTNQNDIIQIIPSNVKLNMYFRIFFHKSIYWGNAFPFNESYFNEWNQRKKNYNSIEDLSIKILANYVDEIDFIVVPNKDLYKLTPITPAKSFEKFSIFDMKSFL